ncbi:MAG: alkaline phosphatase family protein [Proteobacteria bacterium]|nr:alkaline phosphatase family protein [Pseudomonadota bacterium]
MIRILASFLAAAALLAGCATPDRAPAGKPKLVVFFVIDGLPQHQVLDYRDQLGRDGFARFLDRGAWFAEAHYGHAFTVTAAGHATMLTGAYPHRTGVIGNEWRDRATAAPVYCTGDEAHTYIDNPTAKLAGTSPKNLQVETVGDVLRRADPRAKVIGISGKDRGAILPAGKTGTAYMYMGGTGRFASSTYYMKAHPDWVTAFNAEKRADRYFKASWAPLLPDAAYARSVPDDRPWYSKGGKLPKVLGEGQDKPGPAFYGSLLPSPFADALTLDFARAAIAGEGLGRDDVPDILAISLSGHDYVNHAYGPESRLSHDHLLQLDRLLEAFFADLDRSVGKDNYVAVLTADHGFMPAPEYSVSLGRDAGRQNIPQTLERLNKGLAAKFGEGIWVRGWSANGILLDTAFIAQKRVDRSALDAEARRILLGESGIVGVFSAADLAANRVPAGTPFLEQMQKTFYADRSPDLLVVARPYWMFEARRAATSTHGSPHPYDHHVPILFYGPRWTGTGKVEQRVEVVDIAPTLAKMLGVAAPPASEGKLLPLP